MRVPRCRTMMVPGSTSSPSKRLTPSRLDWLSRPFLALPPLFLCAIAILSPSSFVCASVSRSRLAPRARPCGRVCGGRACPPLAALPPRRLQAPRPPLGGPGGGGRGRRLRFAGATGGFHRRFGGCPALRLRLRLDDALGGDDLAHGQAGVALAVAAPAPVACLRLVLEDDDLAVAAVLDHLRDDASAFDHRAADADVAVGGDKQNVAQLDGGTHLRRDGVHVDELVGLNAVLSAAAADYGVDFATSWATYEGARCSILPAGGGSVHFAEGGWPSAGR